MGHTTTCRTASSLPTSFSISDLGDSTEQRLARLEELNAQIAADKAAYRTLQERLEGTVMTNPVTSKSAFALFGLLLGMLPPASFTLKRMGESTGANPFELLFLILLISASVVTGIVGYLTGRYIPAAIKATEQFRQPNRIAWIALIGLMWGGVSGGVGGLFLFIVGAVFAAFVGGFVGMIAVPVFAVLHDSLRRGDVMERKHLLPIAFGITLSICAFVLGR